MREIFRAVREFMKKADMILLALCVASQFLKNLSPYITGPVINCILAVAALSCGFWSGAVPCSPGTSC